MEFQVSVESTEQTHVTDYHAIGKGNPASSARVPPHAATTDLPEFPRDLIRPSSWPRTRTDPQGGGRSSAHSQAITAPIISSYVHEGTVSPFFEANPSRHSLDLAWRGAACHAHTFISSHGKSWLLEPGFGLSSVNHGLHRPCTTHDPGPKSQVTTGEAVQSDN